MQTNYRLFLDLDGVLADFDAGVLGTLGKLPADLDPKRMWPALAKTPGFYDKLPWLADGRDLWNFALRFRPTVLTGLPLGKWAEPQKRAWCARELGQEIPVICCMSRDKGRAGADALVPGETMVLVDDRLKVKEAWEDAGGTFILHTSAVGSVEALRALGFS